MEAEESLIELEIVLFLRYLFRWAAASLLMILTLLQFLISLFISHLLWLILELDREVVRLFITIRFLKLTLELLLMIANCKLPFVGISWLDVHLFIAYLHIWLPYEHHCITKIRIDTFS
jgi:hypothetical protein